MERITEDAIRVVFVFLTLSWCAYLFGLTNALIGLVIALVVMAWRTGLWPFPRR